MKESTCSMLRARIPAAEAALHREGLLMGRPRSERERQRDRERKRERRTDDPEGARAAQREYFRKNPRKRTDERRAYEREWQRKKRAADPEAARAYEREYRRSNPKPRTDARREYEREWKRGQRAADPEGNRAYRRDWRSRNRDAVNEKKRDDREKNPEAAREWGRRRYAKNREHILSQNKARAHGPHVFEDVARMWNEQEGLCYLCGIDLTAVKRAVIDHDHGCCPPDHSCRACRRGLACDTCNAAIGFARDDPDQLRRMADALEAAQKAARARIAALPVQAELELGDPEPAERLAPVGEDADVLVALPAARRPRAARRPDLDAGACGQEPLPGIVV